MASTSIEMLNMNADTKRDLYKEVRFNDEKEATV